MCRMPVLAEVRQLHHVLPLLLRDRKAERHPAEGLLQARGDTVQPEETEAGEKQAAVH